MGSIDRRLGRLEVLIKLPEDELRERAYRELLRRLNPEESAWLGAPLSEAEALVECPLHGPGCACTNEPCRQRAREEHPELHAEFKRRNKSLLDRAEEIMRREPYRETSADRRRRYAHAGA